MRGLIFYIYCGAVPNENIMIPFNLNMLFFLKDKQNIFVYPLYVVLIHKT